MELEDARELAESDPRERVLLRAVGDSASSGNRQSDEVVAPSGVEFAFVRGSRHHTGCKGDAKMRSRGER
jgi:hypothetical protein